MPFDPAVFRANLAQVAPDTGVLSLSATRGEDTGEWYAWLRDRAPLRAAAR